MIRADWLLPWRGRSHRCEWTVGKGTDSGVGQ